MSLDKVFSVYCKAAGLGKPKQKPADTHLHWPLSNRNTNEAKYRLSLSSEIKYNCLTHSEPPHGLNGDRRRGLTWGAKAVVWNHLYCSLTSVKVPSSQLVSSWWQTRISTAVLAHGFSGEMCPGFKEGTRRTGTGFLTLNRGSEAASRSRWWWSQTRQQMCQKEQPQNEAHWSLTTRMGNKVAGAGEMVS